MGWVENVGWVGGDEERRRIGIEISKRRKVEDAGKGWIWMIILVCMAREESLAASRQGIACFTAST